MPTCKYKLGNNWNCGSYAFNLAREDIDQGDLCDRHYWQTQATSLRAALIAVLPFIDDASDVHGFMFPESAASNECRAAVAAAKAAIAKAEGVKS